MRGRGKNLRALFYDELMFMGQGAIELTMAMASLDGCMVVGSSSAARDPGAYGMRMIRAVNPMTGRPVFKTLRIGYMSEGAPSDALNADGELLDPEALYYTETRNAQRVQDYFSTAPRNVHAARVSLPWWRPAPVQSESAMAEYMSRVCERNRRLRSAFLATVPSFHSISALRNMETIMGEDAYRAEILNMRIRHARRNAFPAPCLVELQSAPVYARPPDVSPYEHVYVAYDPAGGGRSEACIVSILLTGQGNNQRMTAMQRPAARGFIICGLDVYTGAGVGSPATMAQHILRHMVHVRRHVLADQPPACNVTFHLIVENNYAQAGMVMYEEILRIEDAHRRAMMDDGVAPIRIEVYHELDDETTAAGARRRPRDAVPRSHMIGFFTNNARKQNMVNEVKACLEHRSLRFHARFFTLRTDIMTTGQMRDGWFKQMSHFGYVETIKGETGGARKRPRIDDPVIYRVYSGKSGADDGNDDRVMATMIAYYGALELEERAYCAQLTQRMSL